MEEPLQHQAVQSLQDITLNAQRSAPPNPFANVDPFARINECSTELLEQLAQTLELRGAQPRQVRMRQACFDAAGIKSGMQVLEVGAGTGVVARELARIVGRDGRVVALDASDALIDIAGRKTTPGGCRVNYVHGDAVTLPFDDESFDATVSVTLLSHLEGPRKVIRQMRRVTRSGGALMILEEDYQTLLFDHSDRQLTRTILLHGADYNVLDGWCGRKLPGLLVSEGLLNVQCWPFVYSERDSSSYLITIAERFAALAVKNGLIRDEQGRGWLQELYDRAVAGTFFASLNYFFAFGRKGVTRG